EPRRGKSKAAIASFRTITAVFQLQVRVTGCRLRLSENETALPNRANTRLESTLAEEEIGSRRLDARSPRITPCQGGHGLTREIERVGCGRNERAPRRSA